MSDRFTRGFAERRLNYTLGDYLELLRRIESIPPGAARNQLIRGCGELDLWFFSRYILHVGTTTLGDGSNLLENRVAVEVFRDVQGLRNKDLYIAAREHFKSTALRSLVVQEIAKNRNIAIRIARSTYQRAEQVVLAIKELVDKSPKLVELWPEVFDWERCPDNNRRWSKKALFVPGRTSAREDPTVAPLGLTNFQAVGAHPDLILADDLESEDLLKPSMLAKAQAGLLSLYAFLNRPECRISAVGTYYLEDGLHAKTMPESGWRTKHYSAVDHTDIPPGVIHVPAGDGVGSLTVTYRDIGGRPKLLLPDVLAAHFVAMRHTPGFYASQYLCRPPKSRTAVMDPEKLRYYYGAVPTGLTNYLLVDPAMGLRQNGDHTAMLVVGASEPGNYYVIAGAYGRSWEQPDRIARAVSLATTYNVKEVRYEAYGTFVEDVLALRRRLPPAISVIEMRAPSGMAKKDRITAIVGDCLLANGRLFLPMVKMPTGEVRGGLKFLVDDQTAEYANNGGGAIINEMKAHPKGKADGLLDCLVLLNGAPQLGILPAKWIPAHRANVAGQSARHRAYQRQL